MKPKNPKRFVTFVRDFLQVNPATVLESTEMTMGKKYTIAEIPESSRQYRAGETLEFGSVNSARDFVKALNEGKEEPVCMLGKVGSP